MQVQPSNSSAPARRANPLFRVVFALITILAALAVPLGVVTAQATDESETTIVEPGATDSDNVFLPADRDLTECISSMPKPGCGSSAKGGWRQMVVFGLVLAGLGFIATRVIFTARRAMRDSQSAQ